MPCKNPYAFFLPFFLFLSGYFFSSAKTQLQDSFLNFDLSELLNVEKSLMDCLPTLKPTVVSIETRDGAGSGVIISPDGLILTAAHVIEKRGIEMKVIFSDGRSAQSISLGGSELSDAGMLKIINSEKLSFAPMAKSGSAKVGDWCIALGHPNGYNSSRGMVLRAGRIISKNNETIQTDCRLLGGDSGGPLFSIDGKVIATHSRISKNNHENFHTPIESFHANWEYFLSENIHTFELIQNGGFLGIACDETLEGLEILNIIPNSPAENLGLLPGDILLTFNQVPLKNRENFIILVSKKPPGETVTLHLKRNDREISIRGKLGARPAE